MSQRGGKMAGMAQRAALMFITSVEHCSSLVTVPQQPHDRTGHPTPHEDDAWEEDTARWFTDETHEQRMEAEHGTRPATAPQHGRRGAPLAEKNRNRILCTRDPAECTGGAVVCLTPARPSIARASHESPPHHVLSCLLPQAMRMASPGVRSWSAVATFEQFSIPGMCTNAACVPSAIASPPTPQPRRLRRHTEHARHVLTAVQ